MADKRTVELDCQSCGSSLIKVTLVNDAKLIAGLIIKCGNCSVETITNENMERVEK